MNGMKIPQNLFSATNFMTEPRFSESSEILIIDNLSKHFSGIFAVESLSFRLKKSSITGLIGPNGAGKTTLFNILSGILVPDTGKILFEGHDVMNISIYERAILGIGRTFQSIRLFPELSVLDNVILAFRNNRSSFFDAFSAYGNFQKKLEKASFDLLETVGLHAMAHRKIYEMSYGQKKLIEILRLKAFDAKLILLDEPTAGIHPTLIQKITSFILKLKQEGRTIFIVEHNMPFIMNICEKIIVMDRGKKIAFSTPKEIQKNPLVLEAYLGLRQKNPA